MRKHINITKKNPLEKITRKVTVMTFNQSFSDLEVEYFKLLTVERISGAMFFSLMGSESLR